MKIRVWILAIVLVALMALSGSVAVAEDGDVGVEALSCSVEGNQVLVEGKVVIDTYTYGTAWYLTVEDIDGRVLIDGKFVGSAVNAEHYIMYIFSAYLTPGVSVYYLDAFGGTCTLSVMVTTIWVDDPVVEVDSMTVALGE